MAVLGVATSVQQSSPRAPTTACELPRFHAVRKTSGGHHLGQGCARQSPGQWLGTAEGQ